MSSEVTKRMKELCQPIEQQILMCDDKEDILDMKIKDFKLPITLKQEHIDALLKITNTDKPPEHMYM